MKAAENLKHVARILTPDEVAEHLARRYERLVWPAPAAEAAKALRLALGVQ